MMWPINPAFAVLLFALNIAWSDVAYAQGTDPAAAPLPAFEDTFDDPRRALVIEVEVRSGSAALVDAYVSTTPPAMHVGDPAQLNIRWLDADGLRIGSRNAWDPRWEFQWDEDGEHKSLLPAATGAFDLPFSANIASVVITEVDTGLQLLQVDVRNTVQAYCLAAPEDPNCDGVEPVPGDIDGDGRVDDADYAAIRAALGKCAGDDGYLPSADFTGDGCVAYDDYQFWFNNYYESKPQPSGCGF